MVQRRLLRRLLGVELMDQVVEGWSARVRRWELRLRLVVLLREELHRSAVVPREEQLVVLVRNNPIAVVWDAKELRWALWWARLWAGVCVVRCVSWRRAGLPPTPRRRRARVAGQLRVAC